MNQRLMARSTAALGMLVLWGSAAAHHSYAQFDLCTSLTIQGQIERISWANPHILLTIDADDAKQYRIEWFDLHGLRRAGLSTEVLGEGDRVVITGARIRNPDLNVMTLLTEVRRPIDGWHWSRSRQRPADCT